MRLPGAILPRVNESVVTEVRAAVRRGLDGAERVVLAVSGGRDSTVLLDAAAAVVPRARLVVATFDHGTGAAARRAVEHVAALAERNAIAFRAEGASRPLAGEAAWREARWQFLRRVAGEHGAEVATAHTRDDAVETILMRELRGAGARGLAGLYAAGPVRRPLLATSAAAVERYAGARRLSWVDDPSNASRAHLRNRLRHDLLPALRRVQPSIDDELMELGRRAAAWRSDVERLVDEAIAPEHVGAAALDVAARSLAGYSPESLAVLWPAIAGRVGVALDRRGTHRIVEFTIVGRVGSRIQLSGGWELHRARERFELRRPRLAGAGLATLGVGLSWGEWRFTPVDRPVDSDPWSATFSSGSELAVRQWEAGDAMDLGGGRRRKVKHLLSDRGITGSRRVGWPVVVADGRIVWVPGVRRSDAATDRSGRPGCTYRCELHER